MLYYFEIENNVKKNINFLEKLVVIYNSINSNIKTDDLSFHRQVKNDMSEL